MQHFRNNGASVCSQTLGSSPQGRENTEIWLTLLTLSVPVRAKCRYPALAEGGGVGAAGGSPSGVSEGNLCEGVSMRGSLKGISVKGSP